MALIDRLQKASYKGIDFLVSTSSINFGQKTVIHNFPNSNRTEIEFLGASEDIFSLEIYINSIDNDYIELRNQLKETLGSSGEGLLVHPYEGQIRCSVVDKVTLTEDDTNLGLARFSVTFQKSQKYLFPTASQNNLDKIRDLFVELRKNYLIKIINGTFFDQYIPENILKTKNTLEELFNEFQIIRNLVPLNSDSLAVYNKNIELFSDNINFCSNNEVALGANLDNVIGSMDGLAKSDIDNISIYQNLYSFGGQNIISPELTVQAQITNEVYALISNYINVMMLGLSYNIIALIKFKNDIELNYYEDLFNSQYDSIVENTPSDIRFDLDNLRNEVNKFFNNQNVRRVITKEVTGNPLVKLTYLLYDNISDYNQIYDLNNRKSRFWYEGDVKVLTNE